MAAHTNETSQNRKYSSYLFDYAPHGLRKCKLGCLSVLGKEKLNPEPFYIYLEIFGKTEGRNRW